MKRVYLYLEDEDFEKASEYIDKVLAVDAEYAPAYVAQVLVAKKLTKEANLTILRASIDDDPTWKKALRFANEEQKQRYLGYAKQINENEVYDKEQKKKQAELAVKKEQYDRALAEISKGNYFWAMMILHQLNGYKDAEKLMRQCLDKYKEELLQKEQEQRKTLAEKEQEQKETAKWAEELQMQINRLNAEIDQLHGLFSAKKKQKLQEEVENLLNEQKQLEQRQYDIEQFLRTAGASLKNIQSDKESRYSDEKIMQEVERKAEWETLVQSGRQITFGHYPQTANGNDNTPIEWLILARDEQKILIVSKYGLDAQPYNKDYTSVTWETCTLRKWLNGTFYNKAFSSAEQAAILTTNVDNSKSQCYSGWNTSGGNNTEDKVFLLSYAEANKYFGVTHDTTSNTKSRVAPTAYAIAQGAYTYYSNKTADGTDAGRWWLRSHGFYQSSAAGVRTDGSLDYYRVDDDSDSLRPALWVNLNLESSNLQSF